MEKFQKIHTLYFSQYNYTFDSENKLASIVQLLKFLYSWFFTTFSIFMMTLFIFTYIFTSTIRHTDTLFMVIAFTVIGLRFIVYKEGRQKVEIFSWLISIFFFALISTGSLISSYQILKPLLEDNVIFAYASKYFSPHENLTTIFFSHIPKNPFVISFSFGLFLLFEYVCYYGKKNEPNIKPSMCGPWALCFEINSNIERIIGRERIIKAAKEIISRARKEKSDLIWVTTTISPDIYAEIKKTTSIQREIVVLGGKDIPTRINDDKLKIWKSEVDFPSGFLIIPKKEVLITTFSVKNVGIGKPDIGFRGSDIAIVSRFHSIYKEL